MEKLKMYAIYRSVDGAYFDYPSTELVNIVMATESEMKELVEKASWEEAPYANSYCVLSYKEATIPRYNRGDFKIMFEGNENAKHCSDCSHFINGKCEYWHETDRDQSNFVADDCRSFEER